MRRQLPDSLQPSPADFPYLVASLQLDSMAGAHGGEGRLSNADPLTPHDSLSKLVRCGLSGEERTIVFYADLRRLVGAEPVGRKIDQIIAQERKAIAEVIRERVAVERTVAEEEERIKSVRLVMEAQRTKDAAVISAEQEAEQARIKEVKLAEASAVAAGFHAKEKLTLAEAEQAAAEKETLAAIRRAEGKQAEAAASGLAFAKVKEADAIAAEKLGTAEARVLEAKAEAERKQGLARVAVDVAHAEATEIGRAHV